MSLSESMRVEAIRLEYEAAHLHEWNTPRVNRCASILGCTVRELCAVGGFFGNAAINEYSKENRWPIYLTIQMNKWERFKLNFNTPDIQDCVAVKIFNFHDHG